MTFIIFFITALGLACETVFASPQSVTEKIKQEQSSRIHQDKQKATQEQNDERISDLLNSKLNSLEQLVYADLKAKGVKFSDAVKLAKTLKREASEGIEYDYIKSVDGTHYISFSTTLFWDSDWWHGFSLRGSHDLTAISGDITNKKPCKFAVSTEVMSPGVDEGAWKQASLTIDCYTMLSGKSDKKIIAFINKQALSSLGG